MRLHAADNTSPLDQSFHAFALKASPDPALLAELQRQVASSPRQGATSTLVPQTSKTSRVVMTVS